MRTFSTSLYQKNYPCRNRKVFDWLGDGCWAGGVLYIDFRKPLLIFENMGLQLNNTPPNLVIPWPFQTGMEFPATDS